MEKRADGITCGRIPKEDSLVVCLVLRLGIFLYAARVKDGAFSFVKLTDSCPFLEMCVQERETEIQTQSERE